MQACPYDALYIDPNNNTAAKCNFCAHRVEKNLEPACVIVCPTQAILAGDLDDANSKTGVVIANRSTSVRKPEKATLPKLHYVGIHDDLLHPARLVKPNSYLWADRRDAPATLATFDAAATREVYDVPHPAPWGWKIAAYLWTKSIAAGVLLVAAVLGQFFGAGGALVNVVSPAIGLIAIAATAGLLIFDLKRPDRFFYLLTTPNFRSWLVLGGNILMVYGVLAAAWLFFGWSQPAIPPFIVWSTAVFGIATAAYSAFLFAQAKGRDFWRHKWFTAWQLTVQALIAGAAVLTLCRINASPPPPHVSDKLSWSHDLLALFLLLGLINVLVEFLLPRRTAEESMAIKTVLRGPLSSRFWISAVTLGLLTPLALRVFFGPSAISDGIASFLALYGLFWFEYLWLRAGQSAPLS
jgi:formate-dependent nitrite reductase membrane component NrfD/NAD-dependent dihydropyrimidine dehydrogenase PreA subunit